MAVQQGNTRGYRGPDRNGIFPAQGLSKKWPEGGPKLLWEKTIVSGWTAPSVADGKVYFCGSVGVEGVLSAFTLDGAEVFRKVYGPEKAKELPRATPVVEGGLLYYESNLGILYCLDANTGEKKWSADLNEYGDTSTGVGGVSASPLVHRDLVTVVTRCKTNDDPSFVAFDRKTGKLAWKGNLGPCPEAGKTWSNFHQSPILVPTGQGRPTIVVCGFFRCVGAVNAQTGEKAWLILLKEKAKVAGAPARGMVQPLFNEDYLFTCGTLMQKLRPDGTFATLWEGPVKMPEYNVSYCHTVIKDGRLIAFIPPQLKLFEAETGKLLGSLPCGGQGSMLLADGMLYMFDNRPQVTLVEFTRDALKEVSSFRPPIGGGRNSTFTHLVVAEGRLFLRKFERVVVYDIRAGN